MKRVKLRYRCDECKQDVTTVISINGPVIPDWPKMRCTACEKFPLMFRYEPEIEGERLIEIPTLRMAK